MVQDEALKAALQVWLENCKSLSVRNGFWDLPKMTFLTKEDGEAVETLRKSQKLMLMVSELGEALEALRKPGPSEKCPEFTQEEEELADLAIRLFDYCGFYKIRLAEAIVAKHAYNAGRPYKHGKSF